MAGGNATLDLTTTGEHTLDAWMREDGLRVDRVLLVTDTNYIPSGLGPSESPFQTIAETIPGGLSTTSISYGYDALYRLTGATYSGAITATFAYDYDAVGNMTAFTETVDAQTTSASRTFDGANRLEYAVDASGTITYTYDANGNLVELLPPGATGANAVGGVRYDYDQRNLMVGQEMNPDGTAWVLQAAYVYDGANDRLRQVDYMGATPITTTYVNDIFGLTQVLVADDGTAQVHNLFGLDLISQDSGSEVRTLLVDGLGSVRQEMVGAVVETATTYSPYGEVLEQTGASGTVYGFTGEQEDSATGLLYLRARYYSPQLKVFQSRDPWEGTGWQPATLNYYTYVHGNPIKYVDPSGNCIVAWSGEVRMNDYPYGTSGICPHSESPTTDYFWNEVAKPRPSFSSLLDRFNGNGLAALIYYFRVDQHGPASLRLENLLNETEQLRFMGINFKSAVQFGIRIPGGAALCEVFEDKQYYAEVGGYPAWQEVSPGADAQMSHFLTAVALAYYSVDGSPFLGAGLARLSTGLDPVVRGISSTSFSEFWNMSNAELAIRLIVGHEVIPDRAGVIGNRSANVEQLLATNEQQVRDFIQAVAYDVASDESQRDRLLRGIFSSNPASIADRPGNSLEDLRLSVKGWIFGHDIAVQLISTSNQAATWLESNLSR